MTDAPLDAALEPVPTTGLEPAVEAAARPAPGDPSALPPVSPDDPCGPDLDLEGDAEFLNFVAATEGILPGGPAEQYYKFSRADADIPARLKSAEKLLARTLDIRLLTILAKLSILNRDVAGFARWVGSVDWLLRQHWEGAHPRAEGGDYALRLGQLMTLEDNAAVLLPLQYARLLELQREGAFTYRDHLVATGAAQPRSVTRYNEKGERETSVDEKFASQKTIDKILRDVEIEKLAALVETLRSLSAAIQSIKAITIEHVGFEKAVELPKLDKLVREMTEFLRGALVARDPTLAPKPEAAEEPAGEGEPAPSAAAPKIFASRAEVDAALASAFGYFETAEPTSPCFAPDPPGARDARQEPL